MLAAWHRLPGVWKIADQRPLVVPANGTVATGKQDGETRCQADDECKELDSDLLGGSGGGTGRGHASVRFRDR